MKKLADNSGEYAAYMHIIYKISITLINDGDIGNFCTDISIVNINPPSQIAPSSKPIDSILKAREGLKESHHYRQVINNAGFAFL